MATYDAFISYSHAKDRPLAAALQSVKQNLGKPWYRRRALRVFRDDTSLAATPQLWPSIEGALRASRFLVLLASPEAAASPWVNKEIAFWLEHKGPDTLLIALADGALVWNDAAGDFHWSEATPLPSALRGCFAAEPKWVDLAAFREQPDPRDRRFIALGADFAAAIHGVPKEDLLSQELRQQRRALSLAWTAVGALLVLFGAAAWKWQEAVTERDRAEVALAQANRNFNAAASVGGGVVDIVQELIRAGSISTRLAEPLIDVTRKTISQLDDATPNEKLAALEWRLLNTMSVGYLSVPGQVGNALELAERTRALASKLHSAHPDRDDYGVLFANSDIQVGDALDAHGRLEQALVHYRAGRDLLKRLTDRNMTDGDSRRRLVYVQQRIGDTLRKQDDLPMALKEFEETLTVAGELSRRAQAKPDWVRALALAHQRMGDLRRDQGDYAGALDQFMAYRLAAERLVAFEQVNVPNWTWRLDLWIAHQRIGDVYIEQREHERALDHYRIFNKGAEEAAQRDSEQGEWQRFRGNSHLKIGGVLLAQEKPADALAEFEAAVRIYQALSAKDRRPRSLRTLAVAHYHLGLARLAMNERAMALAEFQTCLSLPVNESARDAQITTPALVHKECGDRAAQINESTFRKVESGIPYEMR